jgi:hypothetical protein
MTQLLDLLGELSPVTAEVVHYPKLSGLELEGFESTTHHLELLIRELQDLTSGLRLALVGTVFKCIQCLIRDLFHQTGKPLDTKLSAFAGVGLLIRDGAAFQLALPSFQSCVFSPI